MEFRMLKVAVLDMYDGTPNQGMRAIKEILNQYLGVLEYKVFDVRGKNELPSLDYEIYISTGGPGSPLDGDGVWDKNYFSLVDRIFKFNRETGARKKHVLFICHSFQMVAKHLKIGKITERKSMSFGTFPVHKTKDGMNDPLLKQLGDPFYVADFRHWQLVQPHEKNIEELNVKVLALEKIRPHVELERAIMMLRFSDEIVATQYHPEADPQGMLEHFHTEEKKNFVIENYGVDKFDQMTHDLSHPEKIKKTHNTIIPGFLNNAIEELLDDETMEEAQ